MEGGFHGEWIMYMSGWIPLPFTWNCYNIGNRLHLNTKLLFSCSVVPDSVTPLTAAHQASLSFIISQSLFRLMSTELVIPSNHLILCRPLLLPPSIFPRVFSSGLTLYMRWPKYWSFSFSISPSNEYSGLISFRINWFDLLAVQGTLKSLLSTTIQKYQFIA